MNKTLTLTAALAAALAAGPALADHDRWDDDDGGDRGGRIEYARVVSSTPVIHQVRINEPRQECHDERVVYRDSGRAYRNGDALVGAIIGGIAGHQFGRGRGNAAATAAGALIGAGVAQDRYGYRESERVVYEPRCVSYSDTRYEERVEGYDVAYKYHGRIYHTQLPYDPGNRIAVSVDVSPVRSY